MTKLELVCRDENAPPYIKIIRDLAHTGGHGDGRVFVSTVDEAFNIRSGADGVAAL